MAPDVIATCPVCASELSVTRLHCRACGTALEGEFGVGRFGRLSREQISLLESFLRSRGNLRDIERELGLSYPTVRGRIEALVRALGLADAESPGDSAADGGPDLPAADEADAMQSPASDAAPARHAVLERLARHEISAEDAARILARLPGGSR